MKVVEVLTPPSDHHLALAAQIGCEGIVLRCPVELTELARDTARAQAHGMEVVAVEGCLPMQRLKLRAPGWDEDLQRMRELITAMGRLGIRILCYNFMPTGDWSRTRTDLHTRGGARVTGFDLTEVPDSATPPVVGAEQLWESLALFLTDILPCAELHGVELSMHPDDPPLSPLFGHARIMTDVAAFNRLLALSDSPANKICFCQGNFKAMGADIPTTIRHFGSRINYVHFRDIEGHAHHFRETFHDNGPTDMFGAIRAYRATGFKGPIRSDHVPMLEGETGEPGYTMLGRLFAVGYMRGLIQAAASLSGPTPAQGT